MNMKILSKKQIQEADQYTIENEPIPSIDLMERAAKAFTAKLISRISIKSKLYLFCGMGNNGGDGLAICRLLLEKGYEAYPFVLALSKKGSPDFETNLTRIKEEWGIEPVFIQSSGRFPKVPKKTVIVDALFGSGLDRPIEGVAAELVQHLNQSSSTIFAVDLPSGTYCDDLNPDENKICADFTFSFHLPKLAFMLPENEAYIGEWELLPIGLSKEFIQKTATLFELLEASTIGHFFPKRGRFSHKGKSGHLLIAGGSEGKIGAVVLACMGALRSGAGLTTAYVPKCGLLPLQSQLPEVMVLTDNDTQNLSHFEENPSWTTLAVGPGMGISTGAYEFLKSLLTHCEEPIVLDADALNLLAKHPELLEEVPHFSIITPHPKELERLVGDCMDSLERLEKARDFSQKHQIIVVLKGHHTAIIHPKEGRLFFNNTGNAGLAKGGSGDVLTGMIGAFLAQLKQPWEAACCAVWLHGKAADLALVDFEMVNVLPSDVVSFLPKVTKSLGSYTKNS